MKLGFLARRAAFVLLVVAAGCSPVGAAAGEDTGSEVGSGQLGVIRSKALPVGAGSPEALVDDAVDLAFVEGIDGDGQEPAGEQERADQATVEQAGTVVAHVLTPEITAFSEPDITSDPVDVLSNPTDHGAPLVFQAVGPVDDGWLEVLLPIRPNGTTGWVEADALKLTVNPYRIEVDASKFTLDIFRDGELTMSTTVAIGNGATPTPLGQFYLIELIRPRNQSGPYGSYAYGISGYSDTLDSFNGGDGGIGIHGTNRPDLLGQDVSHGCIRVANPTIEEMVQFLPLGTPVHIFRSDTPAS